MSRVKPVPGGLGRGWKGVNETSGGVISDRRDWRTATQHILVETECSSDSRSAGWFVCLFVGDHTSRARFIPPLFTPLVQKTLRCARNHRSFFGFTTKIDEVYVEMPHESLPEGTKPPDVIQSRWRQRRGLFSAPEMNNNHRDSPPSWLMLRLWLYKLFFLELMTFNGNILN